MTLEEKLKYMNDNPSYGDHGGYCGRCPIAYDYGECSSKESGLSCRTCCHYNPIRILYHANINPEMEIGVPMEVLLDDCAFQLG